MALKSRVESCYLVAFGKESEPLGDPWPGEGGMRATEMVKIFFKYSFLYYKRNTSSLFK